MRNNGKLFDEQVEIYRKEEKNNGNIFRIKKSGLDHTSQRGSK